MKVFIIILSMSISFWAMGQEIIKGEESNIKITPILHGTMAIEWDGYSILVDPYGGSELFSAYDPADVILITHQHQDHFNMETLLGLSYENYIIIAPKIVMEQLDTLNFKRKIVMANGETTNVDRICIEAVPMYNLTAENPHHKKGVGNGYILEIDGKRIYISGDTENIPEMKTFKKIDVAFLCMNLPYTMPVEEAAKAALAINPKVVYPYHYRGKNGFSDVDEFKALVRSKNPKIEVRLRDWYPEKPE